MEIHYIQKELRKDQKLDRQKIFSIQYLRTISYSYILRNGCKKICISEVKIANVE